MSIRLRKQARAMLQVASLVALLASCGFAPFEARAAERRFAFEMEVEAGKDLGSGSLQVWLPVPVAGDDQECGRLYPRLRGALASESYDDQGNRILHLKGQAPLSVSYSIAVRRFAVTSPRKSAESGQLAASSAWLGSTERAPLDSIRKDAIFVTRHKTLVLERARLLFDYACDELQQNAMQSSYEGQLRRIMAAGPGDAFDRCVWLASALRSLGIPAFIESGWLLPAKSPQRMRSKNTEAGEALQLGRASAWLRFETPGMGFLPADPARARAEPERRAKLFAGLDQDRVRLSRGRDIMLVPRQRGAPLARFVRPYAELDGRDVSAKLVWSVRLRELNSDRRHHP